MPPLNRDTVLPLVLQLAAALNLDPLALAAAEGAPVATSIRWNTSSFTLTAFGASQALSAVVLDQSGNVMSGLTPTITSADPSKVSVSGNAATAVANGSSVLTAAYGTLPSQTITATVAQQVASIAGPTTASTNDLATGTFNTDFGPFTPEDANGNTVVGAALSYASDATSIFQITNASTGAYAGQSAGTAHVTITSGSASLVVTVTVTAASATPTVHSSDMVLVSSDSAFSSATQLSDLLSPTSSGFFPNGNYTGAWRFVSNFDGSGKNAIAIDWPKWKNTTLTNAITGSTSSQQIVVGDTTGWTHDNNLVIDPRGPNSEEIATGNWSIVDATHLNVIATKNHSAGEVVGCEVEHGPYVNKPFTGTTLGAYYRIRGHAGKTAQDANGIGVVPTPGDNSAFDYFNDSDLSFSGDKRFLLERTGRIYTKYGYSYGSHPQGLGFYSDGINYSQNSNSGSLDPDSIAGKDFEWIIYFEPAQYGDGSDLNDNSRKVVSDAVFKQWINGTLIHDYSGQPLGDGSVYAIQSPATFRTPKFDMTEYFTAFDVWVPTPATSALPGSPEVVLGTQYADATGVVPSVTLNYTITEPGKPDAPYAVFAEVDENGTGNWVACNLRTWRNGTGGSQDYLVTGLTPNKDYTGKIRFTFRNTTGDSAVPTVVTSGSTAAAPSVAHSALYAIGTSYAHTAPTFATGSAALPLTDNDWSQYKSTGVDWRTLSASSTGSGRNPYVYQSYGAAQQSGGFIGCISMPLNKQTLPTGTYTMSYVITPENSTPQYQFAPVVYVWRPSTGEVVGRLIDSATGIGQIAPTTYLGQVVGVNVTNAVAVEEGDVLVWEAWIVGTQSGYVHLGYDGHVAIVAGSTNNSAPQMKLAFPAPINFES